VVNDAAAWLTPRKRHTQGLEYDLFFKALAHRPAHNPA